MIGTTAQTYESALLVSLYREGDLKAARKYLIGLRGEVTDQDQLLFIVNNLAAIDYDEGKYSEALRILLEVRHLAESSTNHFIRAGFHLHSGRACEGIGDEQGGEWYDRAIIEYSGAAEFYHKAKHRYEACALNNVGLVLVKRGRPAEAYSYFDDAEKIFRAFDEEDTLTRLADLDESRAQAKLAENDLEGAIYYASRAVQALVHAGEPRIYIQAKRTLEHALEAQEHALTVWALKEAEGSVPGAAKILQISRQGLRKRVIADDELKELADFCEPRGANAGGSK